MSRNERPGPELTSRLGYLLKHAQQLMAERSAKALSPYGIDGRELAVLAVLASAEPTSQQQAAQRLSIDRTTMVAMLDVLQDKGLVDRHPDAHDRRRNVVALTETGRDVLRRGTVASEAAEREFLAPLGPEAARQLRNSLRTVVIRPDDEDS
jgi:DNA-binding MarR family transcriptional regulator